MKKITINIDNQETETLLVNLSKQKNRPIDLIVSDVINNFIYLYSVNENNVKKNQDNKLLQQFEQLTEYNKQQKYSISKEINISELINEVNDVIL